MGVRAALCPWSRVLVVLVIVWVLYALVSASFGGVGAWFMDVYGLFLRSYRSNRPVLRSYRP